VSLCDFCRPADGHTVRGVSESDSCRPAGGHTVTGVSERVPAVNQRPHQIQN